MEFLDHLTKESENCDIHDVASHNIQRNRAISGEIYPDPFTKLVSDPDFDKIPTGGFLAELNDTKNDSSVNFDSEIFHCKQINGNPVRQNKQNNGTDYSKPDLVLNSEFSLISLFPFVCGVCEKKFDNIPGYFEHLTIHNEVIDLLHCCRQIDVTDSCQEKKGLYSCGICKIMYPSLCTLYKHMLDVERVNDFVFKSSNKTVYAHKEETETGAIDILVDKQEQLINQDDSLHENNAELEEENDSQNLTKITVDDSTHCTEHAKIRKSSKKKTKGRRKDKAVCYRDSKKVGESKKSWDSNRNNSRKKDIKLTFDSTLEPDNFTDEDLNVEVLAEWNADSDESVDDLKISEPWTDSEVDKQTSSTDLEKKPTNLKNVLFPCEVCGGFYKHQNLQKHRTTHDERTLACDQCPVVFKSQFRLNAHKKQVHVDEKKFTCDVCGKSFKAWPYLKQHRQIHIKSRDILCPLCPMTFQYKALLRAHMVTHSDDKPHQCDMCERTFKRVDRLNAHKRYFHSEERNFSCPKCNKTFKTRDAMNRHHRIHLPPKNFCHICGKGFVQKYNMRIHQKVHGIHNTPISKACEQLL